MSSPGSAHAIRIITPASVNANHSPVGTAPVGIIAAGGTSCASTPGPYSVGMPSDTGSGSTDGSTDGEGSALGSSIG